MEADGNLLNCVLVCVAAGELDAHVTEKLEEEATRRGGELMTTRDDDLGLQEFDGETRDALESDYCKLKHSYIAAVLEELGSGDGVAEALRCDSVKGHFKQFVDQNKKGRKVFGSIPEGYLKNEIEENLPTLENRDEAMKEVHVLGELGDCSVIFQTPRFSLWRLQRRAAEGENLWLCDIGFVFVFHEPKDVLELCQQLEENRREEPEPKCVTITIRLPVHCKAPEGFEGTHDVPSGGEASAKDFVSDLVLNWQTKCQLAEGFRNHALQCVEVDGRANVLDVTAKSLKKFILLLKLAQPGRVLAVTLEVRDLAVKEEAPSTEVLLERERLLLLEEKKWDGDWRSDLDGVKIFPMQERVAERILCRMKHVLAKPPSPSGGIGDFNNLAFVILVPDFRSLRDQTLLRVHQIYRGGAKIDTVFQHGAKNQDFIDAFAVRAEREPKTLFVVIDDESHWAVNTTSAKSKWVNDKRLCDSANVLMLLCRCASPGRAPHPTPPAKNTILRKCLFHSNVRLRRVLVKTGAYQNRDRRGAGEMDVL